MSLTPAAVADLTRCSDEQLDEFFEAYYTENLFTRLRSLRSEFAKRPELRQWRALLDECFDSLEAQRYLVTIPALLSVIEGVVSSVDNALTDRKVNLKEICSANAKKYKGFVKGWMWRTMEIFIRKLFEYAPFDELRPTAINRNWILHGRDQTNWTRADSLRLLHALQTIDSLFRQEP